MRHAPFHHAHRREHTLGQLSRDDLVLFDCRFDLTNVPWGRNAIRRGASARCVLPASRPRSFQRHHAVERPPPAAGSRDTGREAGRARRGANSQVIAYDQGNGAHAARLWWLARWLGIRNVAVLDGGIAAWRAAGLPLDRHRARADTALARGIARRRMPGSAAKRVDDAAPAPGNLLVDARGAERFQGRNETIDSKAGHVPGARNHPFTGNLGADGRFLAARSCAGASTRCSARCRLPRWSPCADRASPPATTCSRSSTRALRVRDCMPVRGASGFAIRAGRSPRARTSDSSY